MFKIGDKVVLLKNIRKEEFYNYGNEPHYIEKAATAKYLTINAINKDYSINFQEVPQYWKSIWFKKLNIQLELNFNG